jgi:hypothetical protein
VRRRLQVPGRAGAPRQVRCWLSWMRSLHYAQVLTDFTCLFTRNGLVFDTSTQLSDQLFDLLKGYPSSTKQLNRLRGALANVEVCPDNLVSRFCIGGLTVAASRRLWMVVAALARELEPRGGTRVPQATWTLRRQSVRRRAWWGSYRASRPVSSTLHVAVALLESLMDACYRSTREVSTWTDQSPLMYSLGHCL